MYDFAKSVAVATALLIPTGALADWNGFYAGGSFGTLTSGDINGTDIEDANPFGVFLGYQQQNGQLVFGGEYAVAIDTDVGPNDSADTIAYVEGDLKARVGYDMGQFMPYGVVSLSALAIADTDEEISGGGLGFGLGADFAVNSNVVIGGEIMVRDFDDAEYTEDGVLLANGFDLSATTMSLRAAFRF